jgi:starch synthase
VRRIWTPELYRQCAYRLGVSGERANLVHNDLFATRAAMMMHECDALHFVHSIGWKAGRKAKRAGSKVICDMREEHPSFQQKILSEEAEHLGISYSVPGATFRHRVLEEIDLADFIFCPSQYAKRTFVAQGISAERLIVCPYGVDLATFDSFPRPAGGSSFRVLFLGRVCMRKGIHYLLEGFRQANLPGARLILAGPVDPAFRSILDRYRGLYEEVGAIPRTQVRERYLDADIFVMPSLADSYGLVVSEAMSTGLPVIVSENTGMADLITDGREGFVVPIRHSRAIAEKLTFLHEHRDRMATMGTAAIATARSLDWNNYQTICADFYKTLFR